MYRQTDKILNELFVNDWQAVANGSIEQELYAYIDAELSGRDAQVEFPALFAEIVRSRRTQELYKELKTLLQAEKEGRLEVPPVHHRFNFAYLKTDLKTVAETEEKHIEAAPATSISIPWHFNKLGRLVIDFSTQLLDSLVPPTAQLAGIKSVRSKAGKTLVDYMLDAAKEDLQVQIVARELSSDPSLCTVTVKVDVPSRGGWPNLGETMVTLTIGAAEPKQSSQSQLTDAFGEAHFENINVTDLPNLQFEIDSDPSS